MKQQKQQLMKITMKQKKLFLHAKGILTDTQKYCQQRL